MNRSIGACILTICFSASCTESTSFTALSDKKNAVNQGPHGQDPNDGDDPDLHLGRIPPAEICDGFDNDGDSLIDEGFDGLDCLDENRRHGTQACIAGELICEQCVPGSTRPLDCGCGQDQIETCDADGAWKVGVCDGCTDENRPKCDQYDRCEPGEVVIRRCDTCTNGACGSDCVGAEWRCNDDCAWEQITQCVTYEEMQCSEDDTKLEVCGRCGVRTVTCDGCFWTPEPCREEGECIDGEERVVPCDNPGCADGFVTTLSCTNTCEWEELESCIGCAPGVRTVSDPCVAAAPQCGSRVTRYTCTAEPVPICGGASDLMLGTEEMEIIENCLDIECVPGETQVASCVTELGQAGSRTLLCSNETCTFEPIDPQGNAIPCGANGGSCVPHTVVTETIPCNNVCDPQLGITITRTCRGDGSGYNSSESGVCPCNPGEQDQLPCTMPDGRCGLQAATCNSTCDWIDSGNCQPRPDSCVPGTTETNTVPCGNNACGQNYTETKRCRSDGCGWSVTNSTIQNCPDCSPGQQHQESCTTSSGQCGTRTVSCNPNNCSWNTGACQPDPNSCSPNATRTEACSSVCGPGHRTFTCESDGCGWTMTADCAPDVTPPCMPGNTQYEACPGCQTAQRERSCRPECQWSQWTDCPPCG